MPWGCLVETSSNALVRSFIYACGDLPRFGGFETSRVAFRRYGRSQDTVQGDPYGRRIVHVDSKFEVALSCKVGLLPRPVTEL